jgi:hypothetical protein
MLGDRSGPGFPICSHEGEAEIMTTAAYVVDLAAGDLWVAIGPPDSNEFVRYAFDQAAAEPRLWVWLRAKTMHYQHDEFTQCFLNRFFDGISIDTQLSLGPFP